MNASSSLARLSGRSVPAARSAPRRGPLRVAAAAAGTIRDPKFADKQRFYADQQQKAKADLQAPRPENVEGDFYVDHTCIDCSTCRWVAPNSFAAVGLQAAVTRQPQSPEERVEAMQALLSCPTHSIHARSRTSQELKAAQEGLPRPWPTSDPSGGVYHTGWHSNASFGGAGWLIVRPEGGNVMIDSPHFSAPLARRIQELGGVDYIFLTHKDDVADHAKWAAHFGAKRIIHEKEATEQQGTNLCEFKLTGEGPWPFPDGDEDLTIVHTPGHTSDHCVLISNRHKALFSGDHLSGVEEEGKPWKLDGRLFVFTEFNWYSVPQQLESVKKLLEYDWLNVLPGHGVPARLSDATERLKAVSDLLQFNSSKVQQTAA